MGAVAKGSGTDRQVANPRRTLHILPHYRPGICPGMGAAGIPPGDANPAAGGGSAPGTAGGGGGAIAGAGAGVHAPLMYHCS